ncbi:hypothetical protein B0J14DRAFT_582866 [Halenospora varia]|nr:hypothetical protein B0J14DRAFT_582866 [Halenospora varia]
MLFVKSLLSLALLAPTTLAASLPVLEARVDRPTGGPASAKITIYIGPKTQPSVSTLPDPATAGTFTIVNIAKLQCAIVSIPSAARSPRA